MEPRPLDDVIRNIDTRLERVEQILPTLATKAELAAAVAPLATKTEVAEEGERTRRHFDVVAGRLEEKIQLVVEDQIMLLTRLEAGRPA